MCRLFGWYKPEMPDGTDMPRLLKHLARKSQEGGEASFGMALVKDGKPQIVRHIGPASTWLETNKKKINDMADSDVIVGHTRQPTKGAVTKANTHPFTIGAWAAAHNGMISNSATLMENALYAPRGETDSEEALCFVISYDWVPAALNKITGSFALVGCKADGSEVVLVCDSVQSLHYVRFGNGLIWATHEAVLKSSLMAVGIESTPIKMRSEVIRIPEWTTQEVDKSYSYHNTYAHGSSYTPPAAPAPTPAVAFPAVETSNMKSLCDGCDHPVSEHLDDAGCTNETGKKICSCSAGMMGVPVTVKHVKGPIEDNTECPNTLCKHPKSKHTPSWGCMMGECKCEMGKIANSTGYPGICSMCNHPRTRHTEANGCMWCACKAIGIPPAGDPSTTYPDPVSMELCDNSICKHVKGAHKRNTGCSACQCRLEWLLSERKKDVQPSGSATPPVPPNALAQGQPPAGQLALPHVGSEDVGAGPQDDIPSDGEFGENGPEMISESELAALRARHHPIIDIG